MCSGVGTARAAACCGTGYGVGGRLAPAERAAVTMQASGTVPYGSMNADGRFVRARSVSLEGRPELSGMVRLWRGLQAGLAFRGVTQVRGLPRKRAVGTGIGDVRAFGRYELVPSGGSGWVPGFALTASLTLPTGRAPWAGRDPAGADVTGTGLASLRVGVALEHALGEDFFWAAGGTVGLSQPAANAGGFRVEHAPQLQVFAAGGPTLRRTLSLAAGLHYQREGAPLINGRLAPGADRSKAALFGVASWEFGERWNLVVTAQADLPYDRTGRNDELTAAVTGGLRCIVGAWE
ncbi:MAG: hypothetical protein HY904_23085 [Deltaproteobacteria bacterium]|nr:hypothetical protein [Deltaproteobacteria bacterium]